MSNSIIKPHSKICLNEKVSFSASLFLYPVTIFLNKFKYNRNQSLLCLLQARKEQKSRTLHSRCQMVFFTDLALIYFPYCFLFSIYQTVRLSLRCDGIRVSCYLFAESIILAHFQDCEYQYLSALSIHFHNKEDKKYFFHCKGTHYSLSLIMPFLSLCARSVLSA